MKVRFKSTQGGPDGFQINHEYEMDEKSARHWIERGVAVEVTGKEPADPKPTPDSFPR